MTVRSTMRPVLPYHGSKYRLAKWIISHFPKHRIYTEVFGGSASVLLLKDKVYAEIYNDLDQEIVNVFRVLRNPAQSEMLRNQLMLTPFSREEFVAAYTPSDNPVEQARKTIVRAIMGFGTGGATGKYSAGFRKVSVRENKNPVNEWNNFPSYIPLFCERFRDVVVENSAAIKILKYHDSGDTLHYVDPPYLLSTRSERAKREPNYRHELTDDQHVELAETLNNLKGMIILSGYESHLYADLYKNWICVKKRSIAEVGKKANKERMECLWINPVAHTALKTQNSLIDVWSSDS